MAKLTDAIGETVNRVIPKVVINIRGKVLNDEIRTLVTRRNSIRKIHQRRGGDDLKMVKKKLSALIRRKVRQLKDSEREHSLKKLNPNDNSLWRYTKAIIKGNDNLIPTLHGPNGPVYSDKDKADVLAEAFEKNHSLAKDSGSEERERLVEDSYSETLSKEFNMGEVKYVSIGEIRLALKNF